MIILPAMAPPQVATERIEKLLVRPWMGPPQESVQAMVEFALFVISCLQCLHTRILLRVILEGLRRS